MKTLVAFCCIMAVAFMANGQTATYALKLNYKDAEQHYANQNGASYQTIQWDLNRRYTNTQNMTLDYAAVYFDSLMYIDASSNISYMPKLKSQLRVDSFTVSFTHQNVTGLADSLHFTLFKTGTEIVNNYGAPNSTFTTPAIWDTVIVTSTSLTAPLQAVTYTFYPNIQLNKGESAAVRVDYAGDTLDKFTLIGGYRDECNQTCAAAVPSTGNTVGYYLNEYTSVNLSGYFENLGAGPAQFFDCDQSGTFTAGSCELFYLQQLNISLYVTAVVDFGVTIISDSLRGCPGTLLNLKANGFGSTALPYTYQWSTTNGNFVDSTGAEVIFEVPTTGNSTVSVTVTDNNNVTTKDSVIISNRQINIIITNNSPIVLNCGGSAVTVATQISGVTQGKYYMWSNGQSGVNQATISVSAPGVYSVTVTNGSGCGDVAQVTVTSVPGFNVMVSPTNSSCGQCNGSVTFNVLGGTPPFNYTYPPPIAPVCLSTQCQQVCAGNYEVYITDAAGCKDTVPFTIGQSSTLQIDSFYTTNASCQQFNGSACVVVSGGASPYNYVWSNGSTQMCANNLFAATYTITATDNASCTVSGSVTVNNSPTGLTANAGPDRTISTCPNSAVTIGGTPTALGGSGNYSYSWSPAVGLNGLTIPNPVVSGLVTNVTYVVSITDNNTGCIATDTMTVYVIPNTLIVNAGNDQAICVGQCVTLGGSPTASGGNSPYIYSWVPTTNLSAATVANPTSCPDSTTLYILTVTDVDGCISTDSVLISTNPPGFITSVTTTNSSCSVAASGSITVNVSGSPFQYEYSIDNITYQIPNTFSNLPAGAYSVIARSYSGCLDTASATITQATSLSIDTDVVEPICANLASTGSLCVNVSGGTAPYSYAWSNAGPNQSCIYNLNPGPYNFTVTDANNCTGVGSALLAFSFRINVDTIVHPGCSGNVGSVTLSTTGGASPNASHIYSLNGIINQTSPVFTNLPVGTYSILVTDSAGCQTGTQATLLGSPPLFIDSVTTRDIKCYGGTDGQVCIYVSGGSPGYTFLWSDGHTSSCAFNVASGPYSVTVIDQNMCTVSASATIIAPPQLTADIITFNANLLPDSLVVTTTGGTGGITYVWSTGDTTSSIIVTNAGSYTCSISDANNCAIAETEHITGSGIILTLNPDTNICEGDWAQLYATVSGGIPPFTYNWSPAPGLNDADTSHPLAAPTQTTTYTCTVTDSLGAIAVATTTVTVNALTPLSVMGYTPNYCVYDEPDTLQGLPSGGVFLGPFISGSTFYPASANIGANIITYHYINNYGCISETNVTLNVNPQPIINVTASDATPCVGDIISYNPTYSNDVVNITWNQLGAQSPFASGLSPVNVTPLTDFCVVATAISGGGCLARDTSCVQVDSFLITTVITTNPTCGVNNGSINIQIYGTPFLFSIDNGTTVQPSSLFSGLSAGTYIVYILSSSGCTDTVHVQLSDTSSLSIDSIVTQDVQCFGNADGSACIYVSGGTAPYTFHWQPPVTTTSCGSGLAAGTYPISITDAQNCSMTTSVNIYQPSQLTLQISSSTLGGIPDTVTAIPSGGTPGYTFMWNNLQPTQTLIITVPGLYSCTVVDANNCSALANYADTCTSFCVWPGDADYDGIVNNNDLLAIGLSYGATGTARFQQDINWYGHLANDWNDTLLNGANYKHSDCNGNGAVNYVDTLAINQNYTLTHPRSGPGEIRGTVPALRIKMIPDTLIDGQTVVAHLSLGDSINWANNVYGLAFTFHFDEMVVDSNEFDITFNTNSWLCNNTADHMSLAKKFYYEGEIQTALTRIDHTTRSGGGEIGSVSMKITTGNINGKNLEYYSMLCYISDLVVIDNNGNFMQVDAGSDSATIEYEPVSVRDIDWERELRVYPNPALDQLAVSSSQYAIDQIHIIDAVGKRVISQIGDGNLTILDISQLAAGTYTIAVEINGNVGHRRFIKMR